MYEIAQPSFNGVSIIGRVSAGGIDGLRKHLITTGRMEKYPQIIVRTLDHTHIGIIQKDDDRYEWKSSDGQLYRVSPVSGDIKRIGPPVSTPKTERMEKIKREQAQSSKYSSLFI